MLTLILGGAKSGKSRLGVRMASAAARVVYIATYEPAGDAEMAARVARHRADRPSIWQTIEEPIALARSVERAAREADVVLVDCLTIWLSNLFSKHPDGAASQVEDRVRGELQQIATLAVSHRVIVVSNELGAGTVPEPALTRAFRDTHGVMNQWAAASADEVILTVAGIPLYLKTAERGEAKSGKL